MVVKRKQHPIAGREHIGIVGDGDDKSVIGTVREAQVQHPGRHVQRVRDRSGLDEGQARNAGCIIHRNRKTPAAARWIAGRR